ncbi:MAG TPA: NmrA family NAD(P)-binding protein [Pyrinomonadaceae bacterium]|nr:NmrA family NAD(P)-binding protein [Pyrinomonadaceae bacterium]HMP64314.1 NmrA family NAD(P)-binding protein [Pyrinomonadaceae bacterium]
MKILVLGGTGTVGSNVVRELLDEGADVSVLTRNKERAKKLPEGVKPEIGDLQDPATIRNVFRDKEGVFVLNAVSPTETNEGLMALNGAKLAGAKKIVYLSVPEIEDAPHLPHFGSKLAVEYAIKRSDIPFTILRPNNFYQNDHWFRDVITGYGIYPQPLGSVGANRVDVRDIAEVARKAFSESGHDGKTYHIAGPEALTGQRTAEIWSTALGRDIVYGGDDMDAWEEQARAMLPPWMAFDFRLMYEHFQKSGLLATEEDLERLATVLGHEPRRFEDFAAETAANWTSETSQGTAA